MEYYIYNLFISLISSKSRYDILENPSEMNHEIIKSLNQSFPPDEKALNL